VTLDELDVLFTKLEEHKQYSSDSETMVAAALYPPTDFQYIRKANTFVLGASGLPSVRPDKYEYIIHAEQNVVITAAKYGHKTNGKIMLCTLSPCQACIRTMFQAGIKEVYYKEIYRNHNISMLDIEVTETKIGPYTKMVLSNYESQT